MAVLLTIQGGHAQKEGVSTIYGRRPSSVNEGRISQSPLRSGKSLLSTFPFNAREQHDHHHHHEHQVHKIENTPTFLKRHKLTHKLFGARW